MRQILFLHACSPEKLQIRKKVLQGFILERPFYGYGYMLSGSFCLHRYLTKEIYDLYVSDLFKQGPECLFDLFLRRMNEALHHVDIASAFAVEGFIEGFCLFSYIDALGEDDILVLVFAFL